MRPANRLRVVSSIKPQPPYCDVPAGGYPFPLDMSRVEQSTTWLKATPEQRPWCLLLWCKAWQQRPCGTLPDDDELIAAIIGAPLSFFQLHRDTLMRGWELHDDGRYYHRVVTEKVLAMLATRRGDRERQQKHREKNAQVADLFGVTRESLVSNALVTRGREGVGREGKGSKDTVELTTLDAARGILAYLNERTGHSYKPTAVNLNLIVARLAEGHSEQTVRRVIDDRVAAWKDDAKMAPYLRPATIFGREKFNQYEGQLSASSTKRAAPKVAL
jgi:uncharacterized phage protein (TIGR02220 family)